MTEFEPQLGDLPVHEHDHDVLLIAGSRPEVARLAPVATAFAEADRIRAITVATGPDPMTVHEAFEALGVPADVTLLLREPPDPQPAAVAATLMTRLDELFVEVDPSAVMVYGGGMTAAVAAQVAFWRQIPVVHLQSGVATDDLLCPFPQEANRRIIGQLASLFLVTAQSEVGRPVGPNAITVGETMTANPQPADLQFARLVRRVRAGGPRLVLVDGPHIPQPGDSIRSILSPAVMTTVRQILATAGITPVTPSDGLAAARVEQAVAWMFGLCPSPLLDSPSPTNTQV